MTPAEIKFLEDTMVRTERLLDTLTPDMVNLPGATPREMENIKHGARFMAISFVLAEILAARPTGSTAEQIRKEVAAHCRLKAPLAATSRAVH